MEIHGGISRLTGERSTLALHPIIAARGHARSRALDPTPTLSNTALFARDSQLCMYCGQHFSRPQLTRDHVMPVSKGGRDTWENVVTACFQCNSRRPTARHSRHICRCWRCRIGRAGSNI